MEKKSKELRIKKVKCIGMDGSVNYFSLEEYIPIPFGHYLTLLRDGFVCVQGLRYYVLYA